MFLDKAEIKYKVLLEKKMKISCSMKMTKTEIKKLKLKLLEIIFGDLNKIECEILHEKTLKLVIRKCKYVSMK